MKPTASPTAFTMGAALMPLSTNSCTASDTVAVSGTVYTSRFMMASSTFLRTLWGSASMASLGRSFTSATTMTNPMRHSTPDTANATSMPSMFACTGPKDSAFAFVTMVVTDTMTAVPSDPATWRNVLFTDVPWFMTLLSRALMPQVVMGMFTSESENMRTV